jgi:sugar phosphate permease
MPERLRQVYYGWWIVAATTIVAMAVTSIAMNAFTFYITPMEASFAWSRTDTSVAAVANAASFSIAAPLAGLWVDRRGVRSAMVGGVLLTSAAFVGLHFTTALWQFYILWAVVAFARTWVTFIPVGILVSRWFRRRRGLALTIVSTGPALGGIVVLPVVSALIGRLGWEGAYLVSAAVLPLVVVPGVLVIRERPRDIGLLQDGDPLPSPSVAGAGPTLDDGLTFRDTLRTRSFWVLTAALLLFWMASDSIQPHFAPLFESKGFAGEEAARILQATFAVGLAARFGMLFAIDRVARPRMVGSAAAVCLGVAMLVVVANTAAAGIAGFALLYGVGQACVPILRPLLLSRYFGTVSLGALMGLGELLNVGGIFIGPLLAGVFFDRTGSYNPALFFFAGSLAVSAVLFLGAGPPKRAPG